MSEMSSLEKVAVVGELAKNCCDCGMRKIREFRKKRDVCQWKPWKYR
jgi:hypothetical protein